ncbi:succinylglutamate desuccinylase/aspartoacylase family protein [Rhizobium binxianense]
MHTGTFHDLDFTCDGKQSSYLSMPFSVDRSPYFQVRTPVCRIKNGSGPRIVLMAGNHGDEYEGEICLVRLIRLLEPEMIRGELTIVPFANYPAVMAARRTSPFDGGNLNRTFPGNSEGTPTERIAAFLENELFTRTDIVFDLHAGGTSMEHLPTALIEANEDPERHARALDLMGKLGMPFGFIAANGRSAPTSMAAAARAGAIGLSGEFGSCGTVSVRTMGLAARAINKLLAATGMADRPLLPAPLEEPEVPMRLLALDSHGQAIYATRRGWFEPACELGQMVEPGQLAGYLHDFQRLELTEEPLHFTQGGVVISRRLHTDSQPGDCLIQVARPLVEPV